MAKYLDQSGVQTLWNKAKSKFALSSHSHSTLSGLTATVSELNKLDGVTVGATQFNYLSGLTGNIQNQINALKNSSSGVSFKQVWSGSSTSVSYKLTPLKLYVVKFDLYAPVLVTKTSATLSYSAGARDDIIYTIKSTSSVVSGTMYNVSNGETATLTIIGIWELQ